MLPNLMLDYESYTVLYWQQNRIVSRDNSHVFKVNLKHDLHKHTYENRLKRYIENEHSIYSRVYHYISKCILIVYDTTMTRDLTLKTYMQTCNNMLANLNKQIYNTFYI